MEGSLRGLLEAELNNRKKSIPNYSLRAFAKNLKISASQLSKILTKGAHPTQVTLEKIMDALNLPEQERIVLAGNHFNSLKNRRDKFHRTKSEYASGTNIDSALKYKILFALDIIPPPVTEMGLFGIFKENKEEIHQSIEDLIQKGYIIHSKDGLKRAYPQIADDFKNRTSPAKVNTQKTFLKEAIDALDTLPIEKRMNGTLTFSFDQKLLPAAKVKIDKFIRQLNAWAQANSDKPNQVYNFTIALYPAQKG